MQETNLKEALKNWRTIVRKYQKPDTRKAVIQILNTFLPFLALWVLMYFSLSWSYWITFALAIVNAFFLVRIFIIQHDCGHQSFLKSRKGNNIIGFISSFFSTIPYKYWSRTHNAHHAHNAQLEYRGLGDIYFLTTEEYSKLSYWGKLGYRVYRNPFVQFIIAPTLYLTITLRYPFVKLKGWEQYRKAHLINNLGLIILYGSLAILLGWQEFMLIQLPIIFFFGIIAFWFFYVQHQHEENYKKWKDSWDHLQASILGSTYYKLPKVFQWLSGNIGFHHIHHLNPAIPNYNLEACAKENPLLNKFVSTVTFWDSLKCIKYKLYDEQTDRMISFREYYRSFAY